MIFDKINNAHYYYDLHPGLNLGFKFLMRNDLAKYEPGRYDIDSDRLFALVSINKAKNKEEVKLETHRRYIDIQYCLAGCDNIGLKPRLLCKKPQTNFNTKRDYQFFSDEPESWLLLTPKTFAIFFPHDAHAPLAGQGDIYKVVVKVRVDW